MSITQHTIFNIKKKTALNYPNSAARDFFQGTQERVRNSGVKRAISVRATEVLLYLSIFSITSLQSATASTTSNCLTYTDPF